MATIVSPDPLLRNFAGRISPVPVSPGYALALLAVAVLTVLLPLVYLGLIALVGWLTWWHAVNDVSVFHGVRGSGGAKMAVVAYVGPLLIGFIMLVFMFKPLFARPPERAKPVSLDPRRDPRLFAFVAKLCESVGAPMPSRIDVTCEVNASASFRRGWISFLGQDLVLTIGLNLVAGQNLRQFAGVLAHEFGHFAQGWAMRASYVIRTVNMWFARVVYQRDALDEKLIELSNSDIHFLFNLVLWLARGMVWVTRGILWVLMMIGQLFTSVLSRQMEFDADRHAARLVGREPFASALRELPVLCAAEQGAHADLAGAWRERRLADDLPALVASNLGQIPVGIRSKLISDGLAEGTGMYASHPATRDRLVAGAAEPAEGVFAADGPASQLFADFPGLCRRVTLAWYTDEAGLPVRTANLVPTAQLIASGQREMAVAKQAEQTLGPIWMGSTLFNPDHEARAAADPAALAKALEAADEEWLEAHAAIAICSAGLAPDPAAFKLSAPTLPAAQSKRVVAAGRRTELRADAARAAAELLPRLPGGSEVVRATLPVLAKAQDAADDLRAGMQVISALFANLKGREQDERFVAVIRSELVKHRGRLESVRKTGIGRAYPFEHATAGITIDRYILPAMPGADDVGELMGSCEQALGNLYALHRKCLLALVAPQPA